MKIYKHPLILVIVITFLGNYAYAIEQPKKLQGVAPEVASLANIWQAHVTYAECKEIYKKSCEDEERINTMGIQDPELIARVQERKFYALNKMKEIEKENSSVSNFNVELPWKRIIKWSTGAVLTLLIGYVIYKKAKDKKATK